VGSASPRRWRPSAGTVTCPSRRRHKPGPVRHAPRLPAGRWEDARISVEVAEVHKWPGDEAGDGFAECQDDIQGVDLSRGGGGGGGDDRLVFGFRFRECEAALIRGGIGQQGRDHLEERHLCVGEGTRRLSPDRQQAPRLCPGRQHERGGPLDAEIEDAGASSKGDGFAAVLGAERASAEHGPDLGVADRRVLGGVAGEWLRAHRTEGVAVAAADGEGAEIEADALEEELAEPVEDCLDGLAGIEENGDFIQGACADGGGFGALDPALVGERLGEDGAQEFDELALVGVEPA
jgi:hypothetical protein